MANIMYNKGAAEWMDPTTAPGVGTWEWILENGDAVGGSTYAPDKDDETLLNQAGWVEVGVLSYAREALAGTTWAAVHASDLVKIDCANVDFGVLEAGEIVKSVILARNDAGNYVPFLRIDTDEGLLLPRALGGGNFAVTINASGLLTLAQA